MGWASTRTPPGLGPRGRRLWRAVTADFELPEHENILLMEAARTADHLDALAVVLATDGPMVDGRPHPALVESLQQRLTMARLLASLRVPDEDDTRPQRRGASRGTYST